MLKIRSFQASGYRSLHNVEMRIGDLTVLVGANGSGKTNLYRGLQLLQSAARGTFAREIASEGGMSSVIWAGRRKAGEPVRISLAVELEAAAGGVYRYAIEAGLPVSSAAAFDLEPQVKTERLDFLHGRRRRPLLERKNRHLMVWDEADQPHELSTTLLASETGLAAIEAASAFPDQHLVRRTLTDWRFYHEFRTDAASALRAPGQAITTQTLASDGHDLAAVFATLHHVRGDMTDVQAAVADAFPGARLDVVLGSESVRFGLASPDFRTDGGTPRVFAAGELSDGTLRYLGLVGALLAYRLPGFIALNEPETSLHPDLVAPLARLILRAADDTQIWVVTHSEALARALEQGGAVARRVSKQHGMTQIGMLEDEPAD